MQILTSLRHLNSAGRRALGAAPLPRRWTRVRKWTEHSGTGTPDIRSMKWMLNEEKLGRG